MSDFKMPYDPTNQQMNPIAAFLIFGLMAIMVVGLLGGALDGGEYSSNSGSNDELYVTAFQSFSSSAPSGNSDSFGLKIQPETNSGITADTAAYQPPLPQAAWQTEWNGELDLPFTEHAKAGHNGSGEMGAEKIRDLMKRKVCRPIDTFMCMQPTNEHIKLICPLYPDNPAKDSLWAGLIIGLANGYTGPVIVTGYPAPFTYWMESVRRDQCVTGLYIP